MTTTVLPVQHDLAGLFKAALERAVASGALDLDPAAIPEPALERPRLPEHGDWATNVAMVLARAAKAPPRKVAEAMVAHLELPDWVAGVEVAGPGFVNVRLDQSWFAGLVRRVLAEGQSYGTIDLGHGERVNVEFISANPTGPLHVGNARLAPTGDALANLLAATGHKVEREYYFNDAGSQIEQLGASVEAAYLQLVGRPFELPADGYRGAYVAEAAAELVAEEGEALADLDPDDRRARITDWAFPRMLAGIRQTLVRLGVEFDVWFSERTLHESGAIAETVEELGERGVVEDRDGAVWLRTTQFGDDKDRPLIRSNGAPTYFGADAAYYRDKRRRGFDRLIFLWGADHHGYVPRMRAVVRVTSPPSTTCWTRSARTPSGTRCCASPWTRRSSSTSRRSPASRSTTRSTTSSTRTPASPASSARATRSGSAPSRSRRPTSACSPIRWRPPSCAAWPRTRSWSSRPPASAPPTA
jgi:arginyl-tRNA synthetase